MSVKEHKLELVKIDDIISDGHNPNVMSEQQERDLIANMEEFGFLQPVIIDQNNVVCDGEHRLKVYKKFGKTEIPVYRLELTDSKRRMLRQIMNKLHGEHDKKLDLEEIKRIMEQEDEEVFKHLLTSQRNEINKMIELIKNNESIIDEDDAPGLPIDPRLKLGDLVILGRHRLLCGDATNEADYVKLMSGDKADLIVTAPPYNVDYEGGTKEALKIDNDHMSPEDFRTFLNASYSNMHTVIKEGGVAYIFHADSNAHIFRDSFVNKGFKLSEILIWVKNSIILGRNDYHWKHEPIIYGWKEGAKHEWYSNRKQSTIIEMDKPFRSTEHPTMKPVKLINYLIANSSKQGDIVLDPFGGSGTTLISCERTGRACRMLELDPRYCEVIIKRYVKIVGNNKIMINKTEMEWS